MKQIAVIGGGTMGNGIVHVFAQNGYQVALIDVKPEILEKALATISKNLDRQVAKGVIDEDKKSATLANIKTFTGISDGVEGADLVVEAATENLDIKLNVLRNRSAYSHPTHPPSVSPKSVRLRTGLRR
jgi:3-hydroxybutyryl-CoA dehydrogenase